MKHRDSRNESGPLQTLDDFARCIGSGVPSGSQHDGHGHLALPPGHRRVQNPPRACQADLHEVGLEPGQHDLCFGVAEPAIELQQFRPRTGQHESRVEDAAERATLLGHALQRGADDRLHGPRDEVVRHERGGRERAHPSRVGPLVPVQRALEISGRRHGHGALAVAEDQERGLLAPEEFFHQQGVARRPELALGQDAVNALQRLVQIPADQDALARGESIRLEHEGKADASPAQVVRGHPGIAECRVGRLGDAVPVAEGLGKGLGALQAGGCRGRAEARDARPGRRVAQPEHEGHFGARNDEPYAVTLREGHQSGHIIGLDGDGFHAFAAPAVPGSPVEMFGPGRLDQRPRQGVLSAARTHQKDPHRSSKALFYRS